MRRLASILGMTICIWLAACSGVGEPTLTASATVMPATHTAAPSPSTTATHPPTPTDRPTSTSTALPPTAMQTPTPTRTPNPAPSPTPDPRRRVVAFVSDWSGDDDIYLLDLGTGAVVNLTRGQGEDRDPVFAPDGRTLILRSNAGGAWAFYRIDLATGKRTPLTGDETQEAAYHGRIAWNAHQAEGYAYESYRSGNLDLYVYEPTGRERKLTDHQAGDYAPAWRPGTSQVAFASWREGNKDLYLIDVDGGKLTRLTDGQADEESPAWHPDGQRLAFVRWLDGNADLYEMQVTGESVRVTTDPYPDRSPTYGPDGALFWTRYVPGEPFELHDPYRMGRWQLWTRDLAGQETQVSLPIAEMDVYTPAAGFALWPDLPTLNEIPTPEATTTPGTLAGTVTLDIACAGNHPTIHARLADAYDAWQAQVLAQTGYDFLGQISDMFRPLGYSGRDHGHLSWHRTGRAVDFLFEWHDPEDGKNRLLVVREDLGPQTYWRLYLLARDQDGTMGEPLTKTPWVFWFELDPAKEPVAYTTGGKPGEIPPGYYVDLTRLAKRHGWHRIASYEEKDFDWRSDSVGREFWHYQRTDGLTWWEAMLEIYPLESVQDLYGWSVLEEMGMDPAWLRAKGIPTPVP